MAKKNLYSVKFIVERESAQAGTAGFNIEKTADYFDAGWNIGTLFHDTFEHFFEDSEMFRTSELSNAGECVAMGVHMYLDQRSGLVENFAVSNDYHGTEWNAVSVAVSQVAEQANEGTIYTNNFEYKTLSDYVCEDNFLGIVSNKYPDLIKDYKSNVTTYFEDIEKAFDYGYWLGGKLFDSEMLWDMQEFMENLSYFMEKTEISKQDMFDMVFPLEGSTLTVDVAKGRILATFIIPGYTPITVSNLMGESTMKKKVRQFENIMYTQYAY